MNESIVIQCDVCPCYVQPASMEVCSIEGDC